MGPKAKKALTKRGQEAGDKEKLDEIDKEFYEIQLRDANQKLARLRTRNMELEDELEETKKALQKLDEDRADIIAFLKRTLQSKADEIIELQERLAAVQQAREQEKRMFIEKIKSMEFDFKVMHEQLTSELKLLNGKLNSLEEFRSQREELMNKFIVQEAQMEEQEARHKQTLYEIERKFIIAKDELKKDMESKLLQLSLDFQNATQMRIAATTQRVIRENVAVNNELAALMESWRHLSENVESLKGKERSQRLEIELHKEEKNAFITRNEIQTRVIDKISTEHERLLTFYYKMCHYEKRSKILEEDLQESKKSLDEKEKQLMEASQLVHFYEIQLKEYQHKFDDAHSETERLETIMTKARKIIMDCLILGTSDTSVRRSLREQRLRLMEKEDEDTEPQPILEIKVGEEDDEEEEEEGEPEDDGLATFCRQSLLSTLLELFNTVGYGDKDLSSQLLIPSADTLVNIADPHFYRIGDLGIIPKVESKDETEEKFVCGETKK